jgi:hypothetical protein
MIEEDEIQNNLNIINLACKINVALLHDLKYISECNRIAYINSVTMIKNSNSN